MESQQYDRDFTSGAFVVLKTDFAEKNEPPLWKIDGKALLQKYTPVEEKGKLYYKNTFTYTSWSITDKDKYYPAPIVFKMQNRKETIVEFLRDKVKVDPSSDDEEERQKGKFEEVFIPESGDLIDCEEEDVLEVEP